MNKIPAISLIIAVYNRVEALEMIFTALTRQSFKDFEIVVADDGSGREIKDCITVWQGIFSHPIKHIYHDDNGFRKTIIINNAVVASSAEYLVFIDGDCIPHHLYLEDHWNRRERGAVLTGRRLMMSPKATTKFSINDIQNGHFENPFRWIFNNELHTAQYAFRIPNIDTYRNKKRNNYFVLGCNFSLHRDDFLKVNGYDERIIGRGMEDNNLHVRFLAAKMPMRSISQVAIQYHLYHDSGPIPHSEEVQKQFCVASESWTEFGIIKGNQPK